MKKTAQPIADDATHTPENDQNSPVELRTKVFVLGFPKSGTSTLQKAFTEAGLRSAHWLTDEGFCGQLVYKSYFSGRSPLALLNTYDCITQADVCLPDNGINFWPNLDIQIIIDIHQRHPECLLIMNKRNIDDLIVSLSRWSDFRARITKSDIPGLPRGYGDDDEHLRMWIERHYRLMDQLFINNDKYLQFHIEDKNCKELIEDKMKIKLPWWGVANKNPTY